MANLLPFQPNHRTHKRLREKREQEKRRLIAKIGINQEDAPLFDEYLKFMVYSLGIGKNEPY